MFIRQLKLGTSIYTAVTWSVGYRKKSKVVENLKPWT